LKDEHEEEVKIVSIYEIDKEDYCQPLIDYLEHEKLPSESKNKTKIQQGASSFLCTKGTLYQSSFLSLWLRCLDEEEQIQVIGRAYVGI